MRVLEKNDYLDSMNKHYFLVVQFVWFMLKNHTKLFSKNTY